METTDHDLIKKQKLILSDSMRELGPIRFIIGGAFILFAVIVLWNGIYIMAVINIILGLLVMENCSEITIDQEKMLMVKKVGVFKPFLTIRSNTIHDVVAISVKTVSTMQNSRGLNAKSIKIRYRLFFEKSDKQIHIKTFFEKSKANGLAKEISKLLDVKIDKKTTE